MKPRLKYGWYYCHGYGVEIGGWYCDGSFGMTPQDAWEKWNGRAMEQQLCPPKPTMRQKLDRWWKQHMENAAAWDTSARFF